MTVVHDLMVGLSVSPLRRRIGKGADPQAGRSCYECLPRILNPGKSRWTSGHSNNCAELKPGLFFVLMGEYEVSEL